MTQPARLTRPCCRQGFWAVLTQAAFSFIGTEIVAVVAGETQNPRRNLPKAIKRVYVRILLFYILGVFSIGLSTACSRPSSRLTFGCSSGPTGAHSGTRSLAAPPIRTG
jgi:amino acid permease